MAILDDQYCADHGLPVTDRNLAYTARVRLAGSYLRRRSLAILERERDAAGGGIRGPNAPEAIRHRDRWNATEAFEASAMANRRLQRDRESRQAPAQRLALRSASPLRSTAAQDDVDGLALFDQARSPAML